MKFTLEIKTENSVFDGQQTLQAVSEILSNVAYKFETANPLQDIPEGKLRVKDGNGNSIGHFVFEE